MGSSRYGPSTDPVLSKSGQRVRVRSGGRHTPLTGRFSGSLSFVSDFLGRRPDFSAFLIVTLPVIVLAVIALVAVT